MRSIEKKYGKLKNILSEMESVLVAYSGGVDSAFLLKTARDLLGDRVLAAIADSALLPSGEKAAAVALAKQMDVACFVFENPCLSVKKFLKNPPDRCYWCKKALLTGLKKIAVDKGLSMVIEGSNLDDRKDFRPGFRAVKELGIASPLDAAGLTKKDIRFLSREAGLETWDLPASPCLATRIPYHTPIDLTAVRRIDRAEQFLRKNGVAPVRVRHHGDTARIETHPEFFPMLTETDFRQKINAAFKRLGYLYISLDLGGYAMGSMNKRV